jgi:hypothetical protein
MSLPPPAAQAQTNLILRSGYFAQADGTPRATINAKTKRVSILFFIADPPSEYWFSPARGPAIYLFGDNRSRWESPVKNRLEPDTERIRTHFNARRG